MLSLSRTSALLASAVLFLSLPASAALPEAPSRKPPVTFASKVVSTQDAATLRLAMRAADEGNWSDVARYQAQARDPALADLLLWTMATQQPGMPFEKIAAAMDQLESWPLQGLMTARAEEMIWSSNWPAQRKADWLRAHGPLTGDGYGALGVALLTLGDQDGGSEALSTAWRSMSITDDREKEIRRRYISYLSQEDHRARVDYLLWTGQTSAAKDMMPLLTADWRALTDARIALQRRLRGVDEKVQAVPAALQDHPGLLFDRARWRRRSGMDDGAIDLLVGLDGAQIPEAGRSRLWDERHLLSRRQLKDGNYQTAYRLSTATGMTTGTDFSAAEFLAGWLALRKNDEPGRALVHFQTLNSGVSTPISVSRARYWMGRALSDLGERGNADAEYREAAKYAFTFYGQLASEQLGIGEVVMPEPVLPTPEQVAAFEAKPVVKAARLLGEADEATMFRRLVLAYDEQLQTEIDHVLLSQLAMEYQMPDIAIRGGKSGLMKGVIATDAAYPLLSYRPDRPKVEEALIFAVSRQESEFNPRAVSSADARGLMQMLPSTARRQAALERLPYRTSWLTDDPEYNVTLGGSYLADLISRYNGSYILALTSYNAGPTRTRDWLADYGDPRRGNVDAIDWIESIPFNETRNYVQRIMESLQVYRHRLTGKPVPSRLSSDLKRGTPD